MNTLIPKILIIIFTFLTKSPLTLIQTASLLNVCAKYITPDFISDGQRYNAQLKGDDVAEFKITMYGGYTYRIVGCSDFKDNNLIFRLYDKNHRLLYNSKGNKKVYRDFDISSTIECMIEAHLRDLNSSGMAIILIGFKKDKKK